jgi:hypothetical protein
MAGLWSGWQPPFQLKERIADFVMDFCFGDPAGTITWLQSLGCECQSNSDGSWTVKGIAGVSGGLMVSDPVTVVSQLGFLLAGMYWPQVFPDLLKEVDKRWQAHRKEPAKTKTAVQTPTLFDE